MYLFICSWKSQCLILEYEKLLLLLTFIPYETKNDNK